MSYLKRYQWELVPKNLPIVRRNCPKCNEKARYINSEKFRVNANKNSLNIKVRDRMEVHVLCSFMCIRKNR